MAGRDENRTLPIGLAPHAMNYVCDQVAYEPLGPEEPQLSAILAEGQQAAVGARLALQKAFGNSSAT